MIKYNVYNIKMEPEIILYCNTYLADNSTTEIVDNTQVRYKTCPILDLSDINKIKINGRCNYFITRQKFIKDNKEYNQVRNNISIVLSEEDKINLIGNYVEPFSTTPIGQNLFNIFEVNSATGIFKDIKKTKVVYNNDTGFRTMYLYK